MQKQLNIMGDVLKQVVGEMVTQQIDLSSTSYYKVQFFEDSTQILVVSICFVMKQGPCALTLYIFEISMKWDISPYSE